MHRERSNAVLLQLLGKRANLRILDVDEIKTVPFVPTSHPFVERLIGTIRREFLDQLLFWNRLDLERKLLSFKHYYNRYRCHTGLTGSTPNQYGGKPSGPVATLTSWFRHYHGLFQTPVSA